MFLKFANTLNLWKKRKLSYKEKSDVLNIFCVSKLYFYIIRNSIPIHYQNRFQRACFQFIWSSTWEPVSRKTLYLSFDKGGLKIPNIGLRLKAFHLTHIIKLINNHEALWTYFAKYWVGLQLRQYNASLAENSFPHSEYVPQFYKQTLRTFKELITICPDVKVHTLKCKDLYKLLLSKVDVKVKAVTLFPSINFYIGFKNINAPAIDPVVRNICWRLCHDVVNVNYKMKMKRISKTDRCPLCNSIETVNHLFLECRLVVPLNRFVLMCLKSAAVKTVLSEKVFRFFQISEQNKNKLYLYRVFISESRYVIWVCRNQALFDNKIVTQGTLLWTFVNRIKMRILADFDRMGSDLFSDIWCRTRFCDIDLENVRVQFGNILNV